MMRRDRYRSPGQKGQGIVGYAVLLAFVVGLVAASFQGTFQGPLTGLFEKMSEILTGTTMGLP